MLILSARSRRWQWSATVQVASPSWCCRYWCWSWQHYASCEIEVQLRVRFDVWSYLSLCQVSWYKQAHCCKYV